MKKVLLGVLLLILGAFLAAPALQAQTSTTSTTSANSLILQLQAQIQALQAQIQALNQAQQQVQQTSLSIKQTLKLLRNLREGMSGEDVTLLQQILATDPSIYPEGRVTGYFGPLTSLAVKRFQKAASLEQVGQVGPKTMAKLNELLSEGAGNSGKVPPGLLIAPGIRSKLGFTPQPLPGQKLPPGIQAKLGTTSPDVTPPVISGLSATSTATAANILWTTNELANSTVYYSTSSPVNASTSTKVINPLFVINHNVLLPGLNASTSYFYIAVSADPSGNTATSTQQSFSTQ